MRKILFAAASLSAALLCAIMVLSAASHGIFVSRPVFGVLVAAMNVSVTLAALLGIAWGWKNRRAWSYAFAVHPVLYAVALGALLAGLKIPTVLLFAYAAAALVFFTSFLSRFWGELLGKDAA